MSVLYIDERGAIIRKETDHLVVEKKGASPKRVPSANLKQVVIIGDALLTTAAIDLLITKSIDTVFLSFNGRYVGRLCGESNSGVALRKQQYIKADNKDFCLQFSRQVVKGKLSNMRALLMRCNRKLKDDKVDLAASRIKLILGKVDNVASMKRLLGHEGSASQEYFRAFSRTIRANLEFSKRSRRPPLDPINCLLSFSYTLLFSIVHSAVNTVGLDPYQGFYHIDRPGRASLALDLMEEFRPVISDSVVLTLVNNRIIKPSDFEQKDGGIYLSDRGRAKFFRAFKQRVKTEIIYPQNNERTSYERCVELQVRHLARVLVEEDTRYEPYIYR